MMTRHKTRENIFILIFESFFTNESASEILEKANSSEFVEINDEISQAFSAIMQDRNNLDLVIEPHLKKWKLSRISKVSFSILRLAFYELTHTKIDPPIIINEAIELTKKYSTPQDASFVNGVLGSYVRNTVQ